MSAESAPAAAPADAPQAVSPAVPESSPAAAAKPAPTEPEIKARLIELVKGIDLQKTTSKMIRQNLESEFGVPLKAQRKFIDETIMELIQAAAPPLPPPGDAIPGTEKADQKKPAKEKKERPKKEKKEKKPKPAPKVKAEEPAVEGDASSAPAAVAKKEAPKRGKKRKAEEEPQIEVDEKDPEAASLKLAMLLQNEENGSRPRRAAAQVLIDKYSKRQKREEAIERRKKDPNRVKKPAKQMVLSQVLSDFLGVDKLSRGEVVQRIWAYIREKNLQNPKDKRKIVCDEKLKAVMGKATVTMFNMNKILSKHVRKPEEIVGGSDDTSPKKKKKKANAKEGGSAKKGKKGKKRSKDDDDEDMSDGDGDADDQDDAENTEGDDVDEHDAGDDDQDEEQADKKDDKKDKPQAMDLKNDAPAPVVSASSPAESSIPAASPEVPKPAESAPNPPPAQDSVQNGAVPMST